jgi:dTDP-4-amino-4,6-dideoxygalactose transaminase
MYSPLQGNLVNAKILERISNIMNHQQFIMGEEVKKIEDSLADFSKSKYAIACANGTDALTLALMAFDLQPGDIVFVPDFTYPATPESIRMLGGTPFFVDVQPNEFNICPQSLTNAIDQALAQGLKIRGIISVDLFGHPCDHDAINELAARYDLFHVSDAAQSFGASYKGKKVGTLADITTTSFFPTKPLGCYGDGGMLFTNNKEKAVLLKSLTQHGKGEDKYNIVRIGMNSRLDTIQAAVLLEKMAFFPEEIKKRQELARYYNQELEGLIQTPQINSSNEPVWCVYSLLHPQRDEIVKALRARGIPSNVYYPLPLHKQPIYDQSPKSASLKNAEKYAREIFCLPMHGYITQDERKYIVTNLKAILGTYK